MNRRLMLVALGLAAVGGAVLIIVNATKDKSADALVVIANDATRGASERRVAVFELFKRHVRAGSTVADVARLLKRPTWLRDEDVHLVEDVGGRPPPVVLNANDTVFALDILPGAAPVHDLWTVYLRISGHVDRNLFSKVVRGEADPTAIPGASVLEVGFLR
ncbi:hypothetical protein [Sorangium sp. So ce145]|uniref:hypothetical protein n=1 Tax=Sorangium sp. So ce145 TaxID=3133285 RepID=UPI003F5F19AF